MRPASIALILTGFLASTSAIGVVLWSSQGEVGSAEVHPEVAIDSNVTAGEIATVEAFFDPALPTLQYDEDPFNAIQSFDPAYDLLHSAPSDLSWTTVTPLSVDMGLTHIQEGAVIGTSTSLPGYTDSLRALYASTLSAPLPPRWGGALTGNGGMHRRPERNLPVEGNGLPGPPAGPGASTLPPGSPTGPGASTLPPGPPDGPKPSTLPPGPPDELPNTVPGPRYDLPAIPFPDPAPNQPVSVPEPGTLSLLGVGVVSLLFARRKRRARTKQ